MSQINVNNLTFSYEGSFDNIFENVSFSIDTNWKLGFIGRNGKGKTTFLRLLLGKYKYEGNISSNVSFDYFPYVIEPSKREYSASELMNCWKQGVEEWRVLCEFSKLGMESELLYRPISMLSFGERTKVMLAVLFSGENDFLLIDEPTNHLDRNAREIIKAYLAKKSGFILVSHDRDLLDGCVDHVLVLNRCSIEVQSGNFSSWWENKEKADHYAKSENEKHIKEIGKLREAADRASRWAEKNESGKIGFNPIKEHDRFLDTRAFIGAKTKKMQSRVKNYEGRIGREIEEKEGLLYDIEETSDLKLMPLIHNKRRLLEFKDFSIQYKDGKEPVFSGLNLEVYQGQRVILSGENGSGKSSLIQVILKGESVQRMILTGRYEIASGLVISYINQDTSFLKGKLKDYAAENQLDYCLLLTVLRQLDISREQFNKNMEDFSEGQKKKVLIAGSLLTKAHLYIWDEPLNYVDVFSRIQIENLIEKYRPTMLIVEHDVRFAEKMITVALPVTNKVSS